MKIKKLLIAILTALMIVSLSAFVIACDNQSDAGKGNQINANQTLAAQVGYYFEIPTPTNLKKYDSVRITDKDGEELEIENGKVFFDTLGDYLITYVKDEIEFTATISVCDTYLNVR